MRLAQLLCVGFGFCLASRAILAQTAPIKVTPAPGVANQHAPTQIPLPGNNPVTPNFPTLVFDAESKQYDAHPAEPVAPFTFNLTNVWTNEIVISQVHASCGCTTAKLPETPWHIPPGGSGKVEAQIPVSKVGNVGLAERTDASQQSACLGFP